MSIRNLLLLYLALLLVTPALARANEHPKGLVLESHAGQRPRDADHILAPLMEELEKQGFGNSSVAGTRIHAKHSISSAMLTQKQIDTIKGEHTEAFEAYSIGEFKTAIQVADRAIAALLSKPASMATNTQVRAHLGHCLIIKSMALSRLGKNKALQATMGEYIRSFPDTQVNTRTYGEEGRNLYQRIHKTLAKESKGQLQIVASKGTNVYVNERYVGMGAMNLDVFPGEYRVFTHYGGQPGRVHVVHVDAGRKQALVVDEMVDSSLQTNGSFVGLLFKDEEQRAQRERKVTLQLGAAIGVETIILVGIHKVRGRDAIVASAIDMETQEFGHSALIPLPPKGIPAPSQLRALASFVTGNEPASDDIVVFTADQTPPQSTKAGFKELENNTDATLRSGRSDYGLSPAYRWTSWGLGVVGVGVGAYLLSIDGDPSCTLQAGQTVCPERYKTAVPGYASIGAGAAMGLLGFYLWTQEGPSKSTQLSVLPTSGGAVAGLSGQF